MAIQLHVRIDCEAIAEPGPRVGASAIFVKEGGPQAAAGDQGTVAIASGERQAEGGLRVASSGNYDFPPAQGVLSLIALKYFQSIDPSNPEQFNGYLQYLKDIRKVLIVDVQPGSLIITVECSSLEILEGLWDAYCTGHLNEKAQQFLVTDEILKEFGLIEVRLTTTILEEEYQDCREYFLQSPGEYMHVIFSAECTVGMFLWAVVRDN
ncbi:hypothetical protein OS493_032618 [Desmophyllum pertusum]|uniref:TRADD-like N-terminal domain-containing protein n=1 Tax=Desmophyllum pertusum TaxID=174260 RepID=A0A9X0CJS5_9CNID|nr:hypothetical protein OS493_032618 [Desmophyllum pertusum]